MQKPFTIFSWHKPFLPALVDFMCEQSNNQLGQSIIILPHDRPKRYIVELLRSAPINKPTLLPHMLTIKEVIGILCSKDALVNQNASLLDEIAILYRAVKQVTSRVDAMSKHFAHMDLAQFIPWGTRLAKLFEEYMLEGIEVKDIKHTEGEVSAQAASILSFLSQIHAEYLELLQKEQWTTQGLNALLAAKASSIPAILDQEIIKNRHIFIAGFLNPSKTQSTILKQLWQKGANICLHTDPNIVQTNTNKATPNWTCKGHIDWIKHWQSSCELYKEHIEENKRTPKINFICAYDTHSQLLNIKNMLQEQSEVDTNSTAIVLTTPGLLMPTLHHLPRCDFNVSMGYPLNKSPLFALIDAITLLHKLQNKTHKERYYWKSLLHCVRHPYLQMLKTIPPQDGNNNIEQNAAPIRHILQSVEKIIRNKGPYIEIQSLTREALVDVGHISEEQANLTNDIFAALLENFSSIKTPYDLATALMNLCQILLNNGYEIWQNSPLDAEALYRLMQSIIPSLKASALAHEHMPRTTLFILLHELMQNERVPFEADPITGLQVLGLLETRLLHFEQVIIVDATDDILPGFAAQDPLLPDALRHIIGLPNAQEREQSIAHNMHRLMASSAKVYFYWQEGTNNSNLFDGKKSRSRFIDSAIWKEELELGYIINNNDAPLKSVPCVVTPIVRKAQNIFVREELHTKLMAMLSHGISPTSLDTYLQCPQRFAWENIYKFTPLDEVNEGYDPLEVGKLLHEVLFNVYQPLKEQDVYKSNLDPQLIDKYFESCLSKASLNLPPDSLIMLRMAAPLRLKRFLNNQPEKTHILALEQKLFAPINIAPQGRMQSFKLMGILDRIDLREVENMHRTMVLDYKTGKLPSIRRDIFEDDALWQRIKLWSPTCKDSQDLLMDVAKAFTSIQLPCYIYLCKHNFKNPVHDAAWVCLAENGEEHYLIGDGLEEELRRHIIEEQIPLLLNFIISHLATTTELYPLEGEYCKYCPYTALCFK